MQFSVPQFIDVEDKIVGPFTGKQTIYLMAGGAVVLMAVTLFNLMFAVMVCALVIPITLAFVFYKPRGISLAKYLANTIDFLTTDHLYLWRRDPSVVMFKAVQKKQTAGEEPIKSVSRSRIRDLASLLDTSAAVDVQYEADTRPDDETFRG